MEQIQSNGGVIDFSGGMSYSYELVSYNEKGKPKTVKFGTEKELKEGAFICLTVKSVQGVVDWKEVQYNELPARGSDPFYCTLEIKCLFAFLKRKADMKQLKKVKNQSMIILCCFA